MALVNGKVRRRILKGLRRLGAWLAHRAWLHRAGFMPLWVGAGVAAAGGALEVAAAPPLAPATAALLLAGMTWFRGDRLSGPLQRAWLALIPDSLDDGRPGVLDRPTERGYAALLALAAGSWWTAALRYGWDERLWWALAVGVLVFGAPWWWHRGWRRKRPLNRWARRWRRLNSNPDLRPWHGSKVIRATGPAATTMLEVELRPGLHVKHVGGDALSVCSTLNLRPGAVTVVGAQHAARRVQVRITPHDPWAARLPHPLPVPGSLWLPDTRLVEVGRYEDGTPDMLDLDQHLLVVGATGSGKSVWLESLTAHLLGYGDARVVAADLASGATFGLWEPVLAAPLATTVQEALALLQRVFAMAEHRERILSQRKRAGELINVLPPSADMPWLWVIIDEFPDLIAAARANGMDVITVLERLAKKLRKVGGRLVLAAQNPTASDVGSTELRGQLTGVVGLGLDEQQSKTLWGSARALGWDSTPLTNGTYLLRDRKGQHSVPRVAKGLCLTDEERLDLIRSASRLPRELDAASHAILWGGQPAPALGDTARTGAYELGPTPPQVGRPHLTLVGGTSVPHTPTPTVPTVVAPAPAALGGGLRARAAELAERVWAELPEGGQAGVGQTVLAAQLGVSRYRVRGALERLAGQGRAQRLDDSTWCRHSES